MAAVSGLVDERARKIEGAILRALAEMGQKDLALAIGVSETIVSRWKTTELTLIAQIVAALGFKMVPVEMKCYRPESIAAILTLAQERLRQIQSVEQLVFDDE